jgi:hypothetical protein
VRGGLDDALDKLARRDELRRRAEGGGTGTPPAVQDLIEAIAAVVGRNPVLAVTVGVEGAGDPVLLHFAMQGGTVQVTADNAVASRVAEAAPTSPRHADFDIDPDDPVQEPFPHSAAPASETGQATRRISYDDPAFSVHRSGTYADDPSPSHRRPEPPDGGRNGAPLPPFSGPPASGPPASGVPSSGAPSSGAPSSGAPSSGAPSDPFGSSDPFASPDPLGATRPLASNPPHPFGQASSAFASQATRRIYTQHHRAADDPSGAEQIPGHRLAEQRMMPRPLPEPVPLHVDSVETELAAKRLAALLRDNPSLLRRSE